MAEDPEVRANVRKGVGYIHVNELARTFCRELFVHRPTTIGDVYEEAPAMKDARINDTVILCPVGNWVEAP